MLPIVLDMDKVNVAVAGEGDQALKRLRGLFVHGVKPVAVFAPAPSAALRAEAGKALVERWPEPADLRHVAVLFAGDLDGVPLEAIAAAARAAKVLLNVEDRTTHCDLHVPACVRRGDLLLTVSTNGRVPWLARRLALWLERAFGPEWGRHVDEIADRRSAWRAEGLSGPDLSRRLEVFVDEKGWLL